jgi:hypothetical protein
MVLFVFGAGEVEVPVGLGRGEIWATSQYPLLARSLRVNSGLPWLIER